MSEQGDRRQAARKQRAALERQALTNYGGDAEKADALIANSGVDTPTIWGGGDALRRLQTQVDMIGYGAGSEPIQEKIPAVNSPVGGLPPEFADMAEGGAPYQPYQPKQLQVGVTNPAGPVQYDYSHLQQPTQSAADMSRALRSGVSQRYGGGQQNG